MGALLFVACHPQTLPMAEPKPAVTACFLATAAVSGTSGGTSAGGRVVVSIVVDQFSSWEARERLDTLPANGGFARLRREGAWAPVAEYNHVVTDTAPGHATLYTGASAGAHGVFANELAWPSESTGNIHAIYDDPLVTAVPAPAMAAMQNASRHGHSAGSSRARLRVPTVGDALRAAFPDARVVSLSLKDRAAIPGASAKPNACIWFDAHRAMWVTSTAFANELPPWVKAANESLRALQSQPQIWALTPSGFAQTHARGPDEGPGEGNLHGLGTLFPHTIPAGAHWGEALRATPLGDTILFDLALRALAYERNPAQPMLLALSLSSHDYVGHIFGPDSWESWEELVQLDAALGVFLRALDTRFGADGYDLILSSDHGMTPHLPETRASTHGALPRAPFVEGTAPARISPPKLREWLNEKLNDKLNALPTPDPNSGRPVLAVAPPYLQFGTGVSDPANHAKVCLQTKQLLAAYFAQVLCAEDVRVGCTNHTLSERICHSFPAGDDGAQLAYLEVAKDSFFDSEYVPGFGGNHGTANAYDREVPILVRAPGRLAPGSVFEQPIPIASFARTLSALLNVPAPSGAEPGQNLLDTANLGTNLPTK